MWWLTFYAVICTIKLLPLKKKKKNVVPVITADSVCNISSGSDSVDSTISLTARRHSSEFVGITQQLISDETTFIPTLWSKRIKKGLGCKKYILSVKGQATVFCKKFYMELGHWLVAAAGTQIIAIVMRRWKAWII